MTLADLVTLASALLLVITTLALLRFAKVLHELVDRMRLKVQDDLVQQARMEATVDRMERAAAGVAQDLAVAKTKTKMRGEQQDRVERTLDRMEDATITVADNLTAANKAANEATGVPGESADAYSRGVQSE